MYWHFYYELARPGDQPVKEGNGLVKEATKAEAQRKARQAANRATPPGFKLFDLLVEPAEEAVDFAEIREGLSSEQRGNLEGGRAIIYDTDTF